MFLAARRPLTGTPAVRLAVNTRTRVVAACKIVPKDAAAPPEEGQSPAAREAKLLRLLSHPGLLKIYEVLEDGAFHYIFLEYWCALFPRPH
jgi:serine/threonine protein kinase